MTFSFTTTQPAANNNPSTDQPDMLTNNVSTNGILAVDHISFNTANGGNHLQTHLPFFTNPTVVNGQNTEGSIIYGAAGTANTAKAQAFFKDANSTYILSALRAFGNFTFTVAGLVITRNTDYNISTITVSGTNPYTFTITLNPNVTTGNNVIVFVYAQSNTVSATISTPSTYTFAANVLSITISIGSGIIFSNINFEILQV